MIHRQKSFARPVAAFVAAVSMLLAASHAAADVDCTGTVDELSLFLSTDGTVTVSLSGGPSWVYLCKTEGTYNGVGPGVCKSMYATLMAAKLAGKQMTIRFYDYTSCVTIPAWGPAGALGWTRVLQD